MVKSRRIPVKECGLVMQSMAELPSGSCNVIVLLLFAMYRFIRRRRLGRMLLVLLKWRSMGGQ
jgi:hypothetical protein